VATAAFGNPSVTTRSLGVFGLVPSCKPRDHCGVSTKSQIRMQTTGDMSGGRDVADDESRKRKQELRKKIRKSIRDLSSDEIETQSASVWEHLFQLDAYKAASSVGLFLSMPAGEIKTDPALAHALASGKTLFVPRVGANFEHCDMEMIRVNDETTSRQREGQLFHHTWPRNKWGIPEPPEDEPIVLAKPGDIDLLVVPGVCFDQLGGRLGQGKGYYDRFIARMRQTSEKPLLVAVALHPSFLEDESVPMSEHDFHMDMLVLPTGTIDIGPS
jgi:5-formyltetrahydrofolate cyclo-ligase